MTFAPWLPVGIGKPPLQRGWAQSKHLPYPASLKAERTKQNCLNGKAHSDELCRSVKSQRLCGARQTPWALKAELLCIWLN